MNDKITMWVYGFVLGKRGVILDEEKGFPSSYIEAEEWIEGFKTGCAEMGEYENWDVKLRELLSFKVRLRDHPLMLEMLLRGVREWN